MSFAELKEKVTGLTSSERLQLSALLADIEEKQEGEFQAEIEKRMKAMDAGEKVTAAEFEARHNELKAKGL